MTASPSGIPIRNSALHSSNVRLEPSGRTSDCWWQALHTECRHSTLAPDRFCFVYAEWWTCTAALPQRMHLADAPRTRCRMVRQRSLARYSAYVLNPRSRQSLALSLYGFHKAVRSDRDSRCTLEAGSPDLAATCLIRFLCRSWCFFLWASPIHGLPSFFFFFFLPPPVARLRHGRQRLSAPTFLVLPHVLQGFFFSD